MAQDEQVYLWKVAAFGMRPRGSKTPSHLVSRKTCTESVMRAWAHELAARGRAPVVVWKQIEGEVTRSHRDGDCDRAAPIYSLLGVFHPPGGEAVTLTDPRQRRQHRHHGWASFMGYNS